jgi:hypothetical protein
VDGDRDAFQCSPERSTHCASKEQAQHTSTVQKIPDSHLKLHAHKIHIVQALRPNDWPHRKEFAMYMPDLIDYDSGFLDKAIISVESAFTCLVW